VHKCAYCDFNSHVRRTPPWQDYQQALLQELRYWAKHPAFQDRCLHSIFIGGGTPSLAPASLIQAILQEAAACFPLHASIEISMEANPASADAERFAGYQQAGIQRLSLGVQSLDDQELHWLERQHSAKQAEQAIELIKQLAFQSFSLDLIYGLPKQSKASWLRSLNKAIAHQPQHLSCYQLSIEAHTELAYRHAKKPLSLPSEQEAAELIISNRQHLKKHGYQAYEVSNFCQKQHICRHNDAYWRYHDYLGIGAGAVGKWDTAELGSYRYQNSKRPETYMQAIQQNQNAIHNDEQLTAQTAAAEAVWLGLRRQQGVDQQAFIQRFEKSIETYFGKQLQPWLAQKQLLCRDNSYRLSEQGLLLADSIAADLF